MIAVITALCGLALMLAASRLGTAAILLVIAAVAILGFKTLALYVLLPAAVAFVAWAVWLYRRERQRIREETMIGRAVLALAAVENAAGGQSRNHAGGAPTPEDETRD